MQKQIPKIPLSLYIHIPWCIQKCPYCDFNSHKMPVEVDEMNYIYHLLNDLKDDLHKYQNAIAKRTLSSIFIGGGTPSVFSTNAINYLLKEIKNLIPFNEDIEITLEANPGASEKDKFLGYVEAGVNRISMGIQSFNDDKLARLGRIHSSKEAEQAIIWAKSLLGNGLNSFNIDLMHGLPNQSLNEGLYDLQKACEFKPPHLSWYQLTIEPNTLFASKPPKLPNEDTMWDIFEKGNAILQSYGYQQYETSAYAQQGFKCKHNLNYWRFGDYLAIGCGAHGKISNVSDQKIIRFSKTKHPKGYMQGNYCYDEQVVEKSDLAFEFFMNRFRLLESFNKDDFSALTYLPFEHIYDRIRDCQQKEFILFDGQTICITEKGKLFLNDLLTIFLD